MADGIRPAEGSVSYAVVRRFSLLAGTSLGRLLTASVPFNPVWVLWLLAGFVGRDIDLVIVTDIRTGLSGAVAAKLVGIPVVFDLREHYVGLARSLSNETLLDHVIRHERVVSALERTLIRFADLVWVVVSERREQLLAAGAVPSKVVVVSNTPELDTLSDSENLEAEENSEPFDWPGFSLVYVGVLNEFRGLDLILDAMAELRDQGIRDVHVAIAGDGPYRGALERRAARLGIEGHVTFLGWIDADDVYAFLASGDVGVIPHHITELTEHTVPNKLFDCMIAGIPVLTRDVTPIRRIVEAERCGWVLPPDVTPSETAATIQSLKAEESDRATMGENGRRAVEETYNWDNDAKRAISSLRDLRRGTAEARALTSSTGDH